jgi:putative DNA primase/helicase
MEKWKILKSMDSDDIKKTVEQRKKQAAGEPENKPPEITSKFIRECIKENELGDGRVFSRIHKDKYVFNASSEEWLFFEGHHWHKDQMYEAAIDVEAVSHCYLDEIFNLWGQIKKNGHSDEKRNRLKAQIQKITNRVKRLRSARGRANCLKFATSNTEKLTITGDILDANPMLFACENGVLDLERGILRDGLAGDYILKASPVPFKGFNEPCPEFDKFRKEVFSENEDLDDYVQRLMGYAMTGMTTEHIFPMLHGQGRNGKGTLIEVISKVLGTYAGPIQAELLLDQGRARSSSGPSPDIMALQGMRVAFASETDQGRKISPSRVKWLTGGDTLVGRNPHDKYPTSFLPTHTLIFLTNHMPHVPSDDFAFWERTRVIPFNLSFVDREPRAGNERPQNKYLSAMLNEELSGILAWILRGCIKWQKYGLIPPAIVKEATAKYRRDEDLVADFIEEALYRDPDIKTGATDLYNAFQIWWENFISKRPPKQKKFGTLFVKHFEKVTSSGRYYYVGVGIKEQDEMM